MNRTLTILLFTLLLFSSCTEDENVQMEKLIPLSSGVHEGISPEAKEELKVLLADKRIVMIGEQVHGVGDDYVDFLHLTRFLHEEMGFNVIAQEFCFYSFGQIAEDRSRSARDYADYMYWPQGKSEETFWLLDYIDSTKSTANPIIMEGFDPRLWDRDGFGIYLDSLLSALPSDKNIYPKYLTIFENLKLEYRDTISSDSDKRFFLDATDKMIADSEKSPSNAQDIQLLRNLRGYALNAWNMEGHELTSPDRFANRFRLMAENLIWLAEERYPDEKIIVRLHNGHAVKNLQSLAPHLPDSLIGDSLNMGSRVYEHFGEELFIMGSTYYQGTHSKWDFKPIDIPTPPKGSLEDSLHGLGHKYALYIPDTTESFNMYHGEFNTWMPEGGITARYGLLYDAIIFIESVGLPTEAKVK